MIDPHLISSGGQILRSSSVVDSPAGAEAPQPSLLSFEAAGVIITLDASTERSVGGHQDEAVTRISDLPMLHTGPKRSKGSEEDAVLRMTKQMPVSALSKKLSDHIKDGGDVGAAASRELPSNGEGSRLKGSAQHSSGHRRMSAGFFPSVSTRLQEINGHQAPRRMSWFRPPFVPAPIQSTSVNYPQVSGMPRGSGMAAVRMGQFR